ncbi:hypothetical protein O6H91_04G024900 [Diphasiastrum complanatum]|uniref:Uncharacterized protein n=1 Tax=Diphasiastrum complanatum TaxID=34168 RepID=A0ACC2DV81_DIPCM|nr:hypothetical protein O6H91_04G024900 [Diphasiastrum complanatum]
MEGPSCGEEEDKEGRRWANQTARQSKPLFSLLSLALSMEIAIRKHDVRSPWRIYAVASIIMLCHMLYGSHAAYKSYYEVLGIKETATFEEIFAAYQKLSEPWYKEEENNEQGIHVAVTSIIEVQRAFEILSNEKRRQDYDHFGLDELQETEALAKANKEEVLDAFPLAKHNDFVPIASRTTILNATNFLSALGSDETWFIQLYSLASTGSQSFADTWERIAESLDGVANLGRVELVEIQLARLLAEKNRATGHPFFRHGLPSILAIPPSCKHLNCLVRYTDKMTYENIADWCATSILKLPRILYYSPQSLVTDVIQNAGPDKIKVIGFSKTGERAAPYFRKAAKDYWQYAIFAFVLWREQDAVFWETRFGVESAPALLFLKDPGVQPVVYHGPMNSSSFGGAMEAHKNHVLPQLRSITAEELGCDATGYSRGGKEVLTWYCVILAGKPGIELSQMRAVLRSVQDDLLRDIDSNEDDGTPVTTAAKAFKEKRLSLTWLDGEKQKQKYCFFLVHSDDVHETCGPKRYGEADNVPKIFLVRYKRDSGEQEVLKEKKWKNIWDVVQEEQEKLASLLVASYNGTMESQKIMSWISQTIKDGDTQDLPNFKVETPALIPEDTITYKKQAAEFFSDKVQKVYYKSTDLRYGFSDVIRDPKLFQIIIVVAALYLSIYYFRPKTNSNTLNSQEDPLSSPSLSNQSEENSTTDNTSSTLLNPQDTLASTKASADLRKRKEVTT